MSLSVIPIQKAMNRYLPLTFALALALSACNDKQPNAAHQSLMEASKQELVTALEERDQLLALVTDVASTLDQIKQLENVLSLTGIRAIENPSQRTKILSDIREVQKTLQLRREQIADLEERLLTSSLCTDELRTTVGALRSQIDAQTEEINEFKRLFDSLAQEIGALNHAVDSLSTGMVSTSRRLAQANAQSQQLEDELNVCYYIVASKAALKQHKILEQPFLRRTRLLAGDYDQQFFFIGDKRQLLSLPLGSDKVKLHTTHPQDSYEIIEQADGQKALHILDTSKFWTLTNYLVVEIE